MLKKNVTIQYISEKYGLSAATTSRVINKETKFWISFLHWNIQVVSSNIYSGYARILTALDVLYDVKDFLCFLVPMSLSEVL